MMMMMMGGPVLYRSLFFWSFGTKVDATTRGIEAGANFPTSSPFFGGKDLFVSLLQ